jgi:hypothetical protein
VADEVVYKAPTEVIRVEADLTDLLEAADASLSAHTVTAINSAGTTVTIASGITASGLSVIAFVAGTIDGEDYSVRLQGTGNSSGAVRSKLVEIRNRSNLIGAL